MTAAVHSLHPTHRNLDTVLEDYVAYLARSPLAEASQTAYGKRVTAFARWLQAAEEHDATALTDPLSREHALRDYLRHLRVELRRSPATCNAHLAAVNNLTTWLGLGSAQVHAAVLPKAAPRALDEQQVRRLLRAAERRGNARDTAVLVTLLATGLRLSEVAALDLDDISLSSRKGLVTVRDGKGGKYRCVPLNSQAREALQGWLDVRPASSCKAVFIGIKGDRLTDRAVDLVLRRLCTAAGVAASAHVLRHTAATNLVRGGVDLVLVAEILGHSSLETTRRYSLPTEADRASALERLVVDA